MIGNLLSAPARTGALTRPAIKDTDDHGYGLTHRVGDRHAPPTEGELDALAILLDSGDLSGGAPVVAAYERHLASWFGVRHAIAVNSGSAALTTALHILGVRPGCEVVVPATAPLPTAMPVLTCGATPVVVDTLPDSLALDPEDLAAKLTPRTRAAILLPLWGYPADNTAAETLLNDAGVPVIEDACQAHGTRIGGRFAGTRGRVGCLSTGNDTVLSTGEGGVLLTDEVGLADRIESHVRLGHLQGDHHGVNATLAAPLAAIGLRRLRRLHDQLARRRANAQRVLDALPATGRLHELPYPAGDIPNYHALVLYTDDDPIPIALDFTEVGLPPDSITHNYRPIYRQPVFHRYLAHCGNAEQLTTGTFQIPVHPGLTDTELQWIIDQVGEIATAR